MKNAFLAIIFFSSILGYAKEKNLLKPSTASGVKISVNLNDLKIIHRASEILDGETKWNRQDTRECLVTSKTYSLYCALYKASVEVNKEFDHRLGALEEVRRTVETLTKDKNYEHRLMGYNNDPATTFADIKNVLSVTEKRISSRLK